MQTTNTIISSYSEIAGAVPLEERLRVPENQTVQDFPASLEPPPPDQPARNLNHPQGDIPVPDEDIDRLLHGPEIPQKPYMNGLLKCQAPAERISYFPGGFTVATVLTGNLSEVSDADNPIPTSEGLTWPVKIAFYFEFCHPEYNTPLKMQQRRVPATRGGFAKHAAEEIQKMRTDHLPQFPYTLDQIKVVSVEVRSRGTVQARLFISTKGVAAPAQDQAKA
ncbi:hypothetical protein GSI_14797 [Ganoderma sinense ZZ0214-1]|uniref:Uncharacterized protein n=1 Tax=Ganoderma sinense ZZ0214-1 TaxID=1077348 RepID=A0A2G8RPQ8_9APHY|nr:hypothetical protein GSI_14797 [Ganoderma sinense ZZ0214-1]